MLNVRAIAPAFVIGLLVLAASSASAANVRVVHASPDAPAVDVLANGGVLFGNAAFTQATNYAAVPAGNYAIGINVAGTATTAFSTNLDVPAIGDVTIAAIGLLGGSPAFTLQPYIDDNTIIFDRARIRFIHLSPNAPAVDITTIAGDILFGDVTFTENAGYISVPGGTYGLQVRLAGTSSVVLDIGNLNVNNGTVYSVFAMGLVGGLGAQALSAVTVVDAIPTPGALALLGVGGLIAVRRRR